MVRARVTRDDHDLGAVQGVDPNRQTRGNQCKADRLLSRRRRASTTSPFAVSLWRTRPHHGRRQRPSRLALSALIGARAGSLRTTSIRNSICSGISLGKYGDQWDNTSANSAQGYVKTIERALADGGRRRRSVTTWSAIIRSPIAARQGSSAAWALPSAPSPAIPFTTFMCGDCFRARRSPASSFTAPSTCRSSTTRFIARLSGLWLDWMAQGTRVSRNLFHDNRLRLFVEVDHGPFCSTTIFFCRLSLRDNSQGGAYRAQPVRRRRGVNKFDGRIRRF